MVAMANTHHIALIYSLHGNRNDKSGKGKGHVGDSFQRKSESYLKLIPHSNIKVLTSDFPNGKVRNGYNKVSTSFEWNNNSKSLLEQSTKQEVKEEKKLHTIKEQCLQLFTDKNTEYTYSELLNKYTEIFSKSKRTFDYLIKNAVTLGIIRKIDTLYKLL